MDQRFERLAGIDRKTTLLRAERVKYGKLIMCSEIASNSTSRHATGKEVLSTTAAIPIRDPAWVGWKRKKPNPRRAKEASNILVLSTE